MGETAKFLHQIDHALAVSGSGKRCNARVMFGSASDLFELGCATGCDDIPLQVSPGPLRAHVGLLCFEGFSLGYSLANRDLVFEQKDVGPTLCLHTDYNSFDLNVMDRPSLQVRPAGRPSVCLIFHDDFALADEVRSDWPNLHRSVEDLWASVDKIFRRITIIPPPMGLAVFAM
ncbi:hypothetical protein OKA06_11540 [Novosphingobium sp. MW5]|nr:hypothetical protein [Novosphingobium sp. MW5]